MTRAIGFGKETQYGVPNSSVTFIKALSIDNTVDRGAMLEETIDSDLYNAAYGGALKISGSIESNFRPLQHETILECFMGVKSVNTGTNTFSFGPPKGMTGVILDDSSGVTKARQVEGIGVKSMNLTFAPKDYVKAKYEYFGQNVAYMATPPAVTYTAEKPVIFDGASIVIGGTESLAIKSLDFTLDRKLDEDNYVVGRSVVQGAGTIGPSVNGVADAGGSITFTQAQWDEYMRAMFGTVPSTDAKLAEYVGESGQIPNSLGSQTLVVKMKYPDNTKAAAISAGALVYTDAAATMQGRQTVDKKVNFKLVGDTFNILTGTTPFAGVFDAFEGVADNGFE